MEFVFLPLAEAWSAYCPKTGVLSQVQHNMTFWKNVQERGIKDPSPDYMKELVDSWLSSHPEHDVDGDVFISDSATTPDESSPRGFTQNVKADVHTDDDE